MAPRTHWKTLHKQLQQYKNQTGHTNVPSTLDKYKTLVNYVKNVRSANRQEQAGEPQCRRILEEERKSLDDMGFEWVLNVNKKTFAESLNKLRAFQAEHGHCQVPGIHPEDPDLSDFCQKLRRKKPGKSRMKLLLDIGFKFDQEPPPSIHADHIGSESESSGIYDSDDEIEEEAPSERVVHVAAPIIHQTPSNVEQELLESMNNSAISVLQNENDNEQIEIDGDAEENFINIDKEGSTEKATTGDTDYGHEVAAHALTQTGESHLEKLNEEVSTAKKKEQKQKKQKKKTTEKGSTEKTTTDKDFGCEVDVNTLTQTGDSHSEKLNEEVSKTKKKEKNQKKKSTKKVNIPARRSGRNCTKVQG